MMKNRVLVGWLVFSECNNAAITEFCTVFHVPRISGYLFNCGRNKRTSKTCRTKILSIQHPGPKGSHRPGCPRLPLGFPHLPVAQDPMSAPQGHQSLPQQHHSGPTSQLILDLSPGQCPMSRATSPPATVKQGRGEPACAPGPAAPARGSVCAPATSAKEQARALVRAGSRDLCRHMFFPTDQIQKGVPAAQ